MLLRLVTRNSRRGSPDRAALDTWTAQQSQKTKNQALWKRTRGARRKAKAAQFNAKPVEDST